MRPPSANKTPACVQAVRPYVPDSRIAWEDLDVDDADRAVSCAGDFVDPQLNAELRRFLFRDAVCLFLCAIIAVASVASGVQIMLHSSDYAVELLWYSSILFVVASTGGLVLEWVAKRCYGPLSPTASLIRAMIPCLYICGRLMNQFVRIRVVITDCGDQDAIHLDAANPNNTALIAAAVEDRQKYCIDRIDPWLLLVIPTVIPVLRMLPQHAVPIMALNLGVHFAGYAIRPSADGARYSDDVGATLVAGAVYGVAFAAACAYSIRQHATGRERFIAAASAERARRLAMRELAEVDALLQRSLPEQVLQRFATGDDVIDETSQATVLQSSIAGFTAWSSSRSARQVVAMLNTLVSAFDGHLAGAPGVEKVKTIGDAYWAVAGLPLPVACHASVMCRFALRMQTTAQALSRQHATEWGQLRMRVGVHSGRASGSILGTQRLSYEPFGEACEGAEEAEKNCAVGTVCVTERVKQRLAEEADLYGGDVDSEALYATAGEVETTLSATLSVRHDGNGLTYRLFAFPMRDVAEPSGIMADTTPMQASPDQPAGAARYLDLAPSDPRRRRRSFLGPAARADDDNATVRTVRSTMTHMSIAGSNAAWAIEAMQRHKEELETRMRFVMQRAALSEQRAQRRHRRQRARKHKAATADDDDDDAAEPAGAPAVDMSAGDHVALFEDPEHGPFARGSRVPLVYSFADAAEERGFLEYIQRVTHTLRRDVRIGIAALFLVTFAGNAGTGGNAYSIAALGVAFAVALVNAVLLVLDVAEAADAVLPYVAFAVELVGCYLADGNIVGNDPFWVYPAAMAFLDFTVYTISPLARSIISSLIILAAYAKMAVLGKGDLEQNSGMAISGLIALPFLKALIENFSRRAYVERRLADALTAQEQTAKAAQTATLENVVPRHAIAPLREWLSSGFAAEGAIVQELPELVVAFVQLRGFDNAQVLGHSGNDAAAGTRLQGLLEAHKAADALLDRCVYVTKIKTIGQTLMLAGPFRAPTQDNGFGGDGSSDGDEQEPSSVGPAAAGGSGAVPDHPVARTLADVVFVVNRLIGLGVRVQAGVHVGAAVGAVLGTERLSYDILGDTVNTASRVASGLSQFSSEDLSNSRGWRASRHHTPLHRSRDDLRLSKELPLPLPVPASSRDSDGCGDCSAEPTSPGDGVAATSTTKVHDNGSRLGFSSGAMHAAAPRLGASAVDGRLSASISLPLVLCAEDEVDTLDAGPSGRRLTLKLVSKVFRAVFKGQGTSIDMYVVESVANVPDTAASLLSLSGPA